MKRQIGFGIGLAFIVLAGAVIAQTSPGGMATAVPAPDETAIDGNGNGNDQTDALLDCYEKFAGQAPDPAKISPPKLTKSAANGYVLRADFRDRATVGTVDRLTCSAMGFMTQKGVAASPLYPRDVNVPDSATAKALAGWRERRSVEALKRATARHLAPPDAKTMAQLEGVWLMGRKPDKGACLSNWYLETQIEFDFHKSGGRALIYEPHDLFTPVQLAGAEWKGDVLELQGRDPTGGLAPFMRMRVVSRDQMESLPPEGKTGPAAAMYRCGNADPSVTADVSAEQLAAFFPPATGGTALIPTVPGTSDADICARKVDHPKGFLQIEPYGPVHYWVMGKFEKRAFEFDVIRTIRPAGPHSLKLDMQTRKNGGGWDTPDARGDTYTLTLVDTGGHIEIPEFNTSFVKCAPGMHRW
jgi:hypothetical protein